MPTMIASVLLAASIGTGCCVRARSTCKPFCNMGVITMKMISSTSITSQRGVTLMSEVTLTLARGKGIANSSGAAGPRPARALTRAGEATGREPAPELLAAGGGAAAALQEIVDQLARRVVHLDVEGFDLAREVIVGPHRRDGDEQADGGGDQGFGNAARDRAQARGVLGADVLERVDDAQHGAEQADERAGGADGGQRSQAALQLRVLNGFGAIQSAARGLDLVAGKIRRLLVRLKLRQPRRHHLRQVALLIALGDLDGLVQAALFQRA